MYRPLRSFQTTLGTTLCFVHMLNVSHYVPQGASVILGRFRSCIDNVDAHTLHLNNQYLTLL